MMGPLGWVRMARMARRPPPWWKVVLVVCIVAASGLLIASERIFGLKFPETGVGTRRGVTVDVTIVPPD